MLQSLYSWKSAITEWYAVCVYIMARVNSLPPPGVQWLGDPHSMVKKYHLLSPVQRIWRGTAHAGESRTVQGCGGKFWMKGLLGRPRHMWSRIVPYGPYSSGSGQQRMVGRCERSNWPLGSIISGGIFDSPRHCQLLAENFAPSGQLVSSLAGWLVCLFLFVRSFFCLFPSLVDYWTISIYKWNMLCDILVGIQPQNAACGTKKRCVSKIWISNHSECSGHGLRCNAM